MSKFRFLIVLSCLMLMLCINGLLIAQTATIPAKVFVDKDSLTFYAPAGYSVAIAELGYEVIINREIQVKRFDDYAAFQFSSAENFETPFCLRLVRANTQSPLPQDCPDSRTFIHTLVGADIFWHDIIRAQTRPFSILQATNEIGICGAGQDACDATIVNSSDVVPLLPASPTPTPTPLPIISSSPDERETAVMEAQEFAGNNETWQPFTWEFEDGVPMMLVPAGCFIMGSQFSSGSEFTSPAPEHGNCVEEPFWIDKYEVSNVVFNRLDGEASADSNWTEAGRPREVISWFEAKAFCEQRGAALPTELQWEYAARGVDSWLFPWGDDYVPVYLSGQNQTIVVTANPDNVSWVGAVNMTGNVMEWTSSLDSPYPYTTMQEIDTEFRNDVFRILRGGSYLTNVEARFLASERIPQPPNYKWSDVGFRCIREVEF